MSPTANASIDIEAGASEPDAAASSLSAQVDRAKNLIEQSKVAIPGEYCFDWQGVSVSLSLAPGNDGSGTVRACLTCCLGLLPFTVEDRAGRANAVDMAMGVNIRGWDRIRFTPNGGLELQSASLIPAPADAAALTGSLTAWLICLERDLMPLRMLLKPAKRHQIT